METSTQSITSQNTRKQFFPLGKSKTEKGFDKYVVIDEPVELQPGTSAPRSPKSYRRRRNVISGSPFSRLKHKFSYFICGNSRSRSGHRYEQALKNKEFLESATDSLEDYEEDLVDRCRGKRTYNKASSSTLYDTDSSQGLQEVVYASVEKITSRDVEELDEPKKKYALEITSADRHKLCKEPNENIFQEPLSVLRMDNIKAQIDEELSHWNSSIISITTPDIHSEKCDKLMKVLYGPKDTFESEDEDYIKPERHVLEAKKLKKTFRIANTNFEDETFYQVMYEFDNSISRNQSLFKICKECWRANYDHNNSLRTVKNQSNTKRKQIPQHKNELLPKNSPEPPCSHSEEIADSSGKGLKKNIQNLDRKVWFRESSIGEIKLKKTSISTEQVAEDAKSIRIRQTVQSVRSTHSCTKETSKMELKLVEKEYGDKPNDGENLRSRMSEEATGKAHHPKDKGDFEQDDSEEISSCDFLESTEEGTCLCKIRITKEEDKSTFNYSYVPKVDQCCISQPKPVNKIPNRCYMPILKQKHKKPFTTTTTTTTYEPKCRIRKQYTRANGLQDDNLVDSSSQRPQTNILHQPCQQCVPNPNFLICCYCTLRNLKCTLDKVLSGEYQNCAPPDIDRLPGYTIVQAQSMFNIKELIGKVAQQSSNCF